MIKGYDRQVIRAEITETHFGLYTDDEVREMSVKTITSPIAVDAQNIPLSGYVQHCKRFMIAMCAWFRVMRDPLRIHSTVDRRLSTQANNRQCAPPLPNEGISTFPIP